MYLCLCHGITTTEFSKNLEKSATINLGDQTLECHKLGVGKSCGMCISSARELIKEKRQNCVACPGKRQAHLLSNA